MAQTAHVELTATTVTRQLRIAGVRIDVMSRSEALAQMGSLMTGGDRAIVVTPNAAHVEIAARRPEFAAALDDAALSLADGKSIEFAARVLGHGVVERCPGSDMLPEVLARAAALQRRVMMVGGTNGSEQVAAEKARRTLGLEVRTVCPPFGFEKSVADTDRLIGEINSYAPHLLCFHVGAPKSEVWLHRHRARLRYNLAVSFGMALEYYAGTRRRAPKWMQRAGLEWVYRLAVEPRRLWKRYTIDNARFIALVFHDLRRTRTRS